MLTASEVQQIRLDRARVNHETYKSILETAYARIRTRASANATGMAFVVPAFVPGRPVYAHDHAVRYVTEKLRRGGFSVQHLSDNTIFIDWTPQKKNRHKPRPSTPPEYQSKPPQSKSKPKPKPKIPKSPSKTPADVTQRLELLKKTMGWT